MCDCIFCKIAKATIPSTVVYEDDQVIAFDDLNPQAPVHTLVIPKKHYSDIADNVPAETMGAMAHAIQEVAQAKGLEDGFRVISNKGVNAADRHALPHARPRRQKPGREPHLRARSPSTWLPLE